jgi:hypothetical protein
MVTMPTDGGSFLSLRRIANGFGRISDGPDDADRDRLQADVRSAGRSAIPLLVRELSGPCDRRRSLARVLLFELVDEHRERLVAAMHELLLGDATDGGKAAAIGMLAELGIEETSAAFDDPRDVQRRSAAQLAAHLETRADVASAADLLVHELDAEDLVAVVEAMADAAPERTTRLVDELSARLDLDAGVRSELRRIVAPLALSGVRAGHDARRARPSVLALLAHPDGRRVVVVSRRDGNAWRNFAALIAHDGVLDDCLYEDETTPEVLERDVVGVLAEQGYERCHATVADARAIVADAAVRSAGSARGLPSSYYLGRDLLGLGDTHLGRRARASALATLHGRAVDLLAAGHHARAKPLLEHCARLAGDDPDVHASLAACLLAGGDPAGARVHLARAARLEPAWALHHWNLAAAAHATGDLAGCWRALRDFLVAADGTTGLGDAAHADRLAVAQRFVADFERAAHLAGERLPARRRRRAAKHPV